MRRARALGGAAFAVVILGGVGAAGMAASAPTAHGVAELAGGFPDGAPARVTGGFGEDSCYACHWEGTENDGVGTLTLGGLPEVWTPGAEYLLTVEIRHPGMEVAGFQLATRWGADTTQAGALAVPDDEADRVALLEEGGVSFAQHREAGTALAAEAIGRWTVHWTAPTEPRGEVVVNLAAVAGDQDRSQMGDDVYTLEVRVPPEG
jgi:hypothetical protein